MKRKTTYIVGAGASVEFGFPVGATLTQEISKVLRIETDDFGQVKSGDREVLRGLERLYHQLPQRSDGQRWRPSYLNIVANQLSRNMPLAPSIDNFLEAKKEDIGFAEVGKFAIALQILKHERSTPLWKDPERQGQDQLSRLKESWLLNLFRILCAQKGLEGFLVGLKASRFITFNYDRLIEKFLVAAVESYFQLESRAAQDVIRENLNIVHVYGDLGDILTGDVRGFGGMHGLDDATQASKSIRTFTEGISDSDRIEEAKDWCESADTLVFLGFAFLPLNLRAIRPKRRLARPLRVYGTVLGMSEDNIEIAKTILQRSWLDDDPLHAVSFRPLPCAQLISDLSGYLGEHDLED